MAKSQYVKEPSGVYEVDGLDAISAPTLDDYIRAVSAYVVNSSNLSKNQSKAAQVRLSAALGRALAAELKPLLPATTQIVGGVEREVSGALRSVKADVVDLNPADGVRLAIELKPINLAVGRAIWNRFGDIRTFGVNLHLKFPFSVVGGVLTIPLWEWAKANKAQEPDGQLDPEEEEAEEVAEVRRAPAGTKRKKPTDHLIARAIDRFIRAGQRKSEGEAPHLLEGVAIVVYDPDSGEISPDYPPLGSPLRWENFIKSLAETYRARFE